MFKNVAEAAALTGSLSKPSKMPWYSYSIPADTCKVGAFLAKKPFSICGRCYAKKGRYVFPNVQKAMWKRYKSLTHPLWVEAMSFQLNYYESRRRDRTQPAYMRWFDSGDLQGLWHLQKIVIVCENTPTVRHWLPTRETGVVKRFLSDVGPFPENLTVRVSANRVGERRSREPLGLPVSLVGVEPDDEIFECGAPSRGGVCGPCRVCWSNQDVTYHAH